MQLHPNKGDRLQKAVQEMSPRVCLHRRVDSGPPRCKALPEAKVYPKAPDCQQLVQEDSSVERGEAGDVHLTLVRGVARDQGVGVSCVPVPS